MNRFCSVICFSLLLVVSQVSADVEIRTNTALTFEKHILPIFKTYCFDCHGSQNELKGGLDLRLRRFLVNGGDSGPVIQPGDPDGSYLFRRVRDGEMPPRNHKLSRAEVATVSQWIAAGAPTAREEPAEIGQGIRITPEDREFWSFQPIRRPDVPSLENNERGRSPIDALIALAWQDKDLSFAPDADKFTLLRRASLDLTGLPPKLDEIVEYLADTSDDAYKKMLDRFLQSPHYGERWGRHWLDVAGYADSEGYTLNDTVRGFSYKYRDYVIRSLNDDKPFDQFLTEQLAGDELVTLPKDELSPEDIERLTATGFLRLVPDGTGSGAEDQDAARNQVLSDTLKVVSSALMGLTLGCAQCHDHRHDPILQTDYYRIRAIFEPAYNWKSWRNPSQRRISLYTDAERAEAAAINTEAGQIQAVKSKKQTEYVAAALEKEIAKVDKSVRETLRVAYYTANDKRTPEQKKLFDVYPFLNLHAGNLYQFDSKAADDLKNYDQQMAEIRSRKPSEDFLRVLTEIPGQVPTTYLFHRGDLNRPTDEITPGVLTLFAPKTEAAVIPENDSGRPTTGRRLAFARWLTSGNHPLVARVLVNRIWMHHFGRGLVSTPSDFGGQGMRPSHPELLDWLASEFMNNGWSLKHLHKLIMTSTVYRQSARTDPAKETIDRENRLYWRKPIRRLEAEILRDRMLATSGVLNKKMFGPPVAITKDDGGQIIVAPTKTPDGPASEQPEYRRSIYVQVRRSMPVLMLRQFDMPVMEVNCEKRSSSTISTQSLTLMNGDFVLDQAERFATKLVREAAPGRRAQIALAWQLAFTRLATEEEMERSLEFLEHQVNHLKAAESSLPSRQEPPEENTGKEDQENENVEEVKQLDPEIQALTSLCQALLGSSEFMYLD